MTMVEIWKDIEGYEGLYQVSNLGRIRNKKTKKLLKDIRTGRNRMYRKVNLYKNGSRTNKPIHRLVAESFIPNPENKPEVGHKNAEGYDNIVWVNEDGSIDYDKSNLEWVTRKENQNNNITKQRISNSCKGKIPWNYGKTFSDEHKQHIADSLKGKYTNSKNPNSKSIVQLTENGELIHYWLCMKNAIDTLCIPQGSLSRCCSNRQNKVYRGFKWQYSDDYLADWWEKEMEKGA